MLVRDTILVGSRRYGPKRLITGPDHRKRLRQAWAGLTTTQKGLYYISMPRISTSRQPLYKLFGQPTALSQDLSGLAFRQLHGCAQINQTPR